MRYLYSIACLFLFSVQALAQNGDPFLFRFDWRPGPATFQILNENASLRIGSQDVFLSGKGVPEFLSMVQQGEDIGADAVVGRSDSVVYLKWYGTGAVDFSSWEDAFDPSLILKHIDRALFSIPEYANIGWVSYPILHKQYPALTWALGSYDNQGNLLEIVSARGLYFGREGYTDIHWVGVTNAFSSAQGVFFPIFDSYEFDEGFRYQGVELSELAQDSMDVRALIFSKLTGNAVVPGNEVAVKILSEGKVRKTANLPLGSLNFVGISLIFLLVVCVGGGAYYFSRRFRNAKIGDASKVGDLDSDSSSSRGLPYVSEKLPPHPRPLCKNQNDGKGGHEDTSSLKNADSRESHDSASLFVPSREKLGVKKVEQNVQASRRKKKDDDPLISQNAVSKKHEESKNSAKATREPRARGDIGQAPYTTDDGG
jgi:hypothetical protein